MSLAEALKGAKLRQPTGPVWAGPESHSNNGGITFSLLSRFLSCRERFRVYVTDGWAPANNFNHHLEYGNMWHLCEEVFAKTNSVDAALKALSKYVQALAARHKHSAEAVDKWHNVCAVQFPVYAAFWKDHKDVKDRTPMFQEEMFRIPYKLPSGKVVYLRGKMDSTDLIGKGRAAEVWLQENKSTGNPDQQKLQRRLTFDLQTMMYVTALGAWKKQLVGKAESSLSVGEKLLVGHKIGGVRYNVIRRPLSGGKGTIVQHKPTQKNPAGESKSSYYKRLSDIISESSSEFFMRWNVRVHETDTDRFRARCLDPILETLCVWYDVCVKKQMTHVSAFGLEAMMNWQHPFGVRNIIDEGGSTDLDEYLETGSTVGLQRVETLFPELEPVPVT